MPQLSFLTPVGDLTLSEHDGAIVAVDWGRGPAAFQVEIPVLRQARDQLCRYFDGRLTLFNLPLKPAGTPFQQRIWKALLQIPYGETLTYGDLAKIARSAPRPVGVACGANPIPVIIPCHRVLAAGGRIGGYSGHGGLNTKRILLRIEGFQI